MSAAGPEQVKTSFTETAAYSPVAQVWQQNERNTHWKDNLYVSAYSLYLSGATGLIVWHWSACGTREANESEVLCNLCNTIQKCWCVIIWKSCIFLFGKSRYSWSITIKYNLIILWGVQFDVIKVFKKQNMRDHRVSEQNDWLSSCWNGVDLTGS